MKPLTPREQDIAALLVEGAESKTIGRELGIKAETVKTHITHMLLKFGVSNRTQFAVKFDRMTR